MDGTIFVIAVMILAIVAIVLVMVFIANQQIKKEDQKINQQLDEIAERHNLQIGHKEKIRHRIIALDKDKTTLLYLDSKQGIHHLLSLSDITAVNNKSGIEKKTCGYQNQCLG